MIYTIGYGNRSIDDFIEILRRYKINILIDIRSKPYSPHNPDFSRSNLKNLPDIKYIWKGNMLGGLYGRSSRWNEGLEFLIEISKKTKICIMCSELDPDKCHRKQWIGRDLNIRGIDVYHISPTGEVMKSCTSRQLSLKVFF